MSRKSAKSSKMSHTPKETATTTIATTSIAAPIMAQAAVRGTTVACRQAFPRMMRDTEINYIQ